MRQSSRNLDALEVVFDDENAVANGGLVLLMTLADRLGFKELVDQNVHLGDAPGHANVGQKAVALVASALVGGDSIDDTDVLRSGRADALLGTWVPAPSTLGTFLRSFSWADARSLDKVSTVLLERAWAAGAGPGDHPLTIDVGSSICRAYGLKKEGATFGYTKVRSFHPFLATTSGAGEVLGVRQRGGNAHTARGAASFLTEVFGRVRAAGATGPLSLRGDSGFYNQKVVSACKKADVRFSITAKMSKSLRRAIDKVPEDAWTAIPYWMEGGADVAETTYMAFGKEELRLVVRRVKPTPGSQLALFETYEYHAFVTDREGTAVLLDADHRAHAEVELVIRDLKSGPWAHMPSGRFGANAAWLALGAIAHNLGTLVRKARRHQRPGRGDRPPHAAPSLHLSPRPPFPPGPAYQAPPREGLALGREVPGRPRTPAGLGATAHLSPPPSPTERSEGGSAATARPVLGRRCSREPQGCLKTGKSSTGASRRPWGPSRPTGT